MGLAEIKKENETYLRGVGVLVNEHLPLIEDLDAVKPQDAKAVARRLCALGYIIRAAYGMPLSEVREWLERLGLREVLGSTERDTLQAEALSERQKINLGWLAEGAQALAWSLGLVELDHFRQCDDDLAEKAPFKADISPFVRGAKLLPLAAIQRQADLLYRMHWATVECRMSGRDCPLHEGLIRERRRALDWVYGVCEDWDEVALDT